MDPRGNLDLVTKLSNYCNVCNVTFVSKRAACCYCLLVHVGTYAWIFLNQWSSELTVQFRSDCFVYRLRAGIIFL
jgi:hypothetical protein